MNLHSTRISEEKINDLDLALEIVMEKSRAVSLKSFTASAWRDESCENLSFTFTHNEDDDHQINMYMEKGGAVSLFLPEAINAIEVRVDKVKLRETGRVKLIDGQRALTKEALAAIKAVYRASQLV